jgi:signal transduction histidine kinase/CheY-like chemotaxis protein
VVVEGSTPVMRTTGTLRHSGATYLDRDAAGSEDPDVRLKARVLLIYGAFVVCLSLAWGVSYIAYGTYGLATFFFVTAAVFVGAVGVAWRVGKVDLACHLNILVGLVWTCVATYFTGGPRLTNVCPFFGLMVAPVFLLGRTGYLWSLVTVLAVAVFEAGQWLGYPFPDLVPESYRPLDGLLTAVASMFVVAVFTVSYESARRSTSARLEAAVAAKNRLLANISHEIRTPLHAMMGVNRLLQMQVTEPEQGALLKTSQENAESLMALFDDLLDLARIDHGHFQLHPADFDVIDLVESVAQVIRHLSEEKGLEVCLEVGPGVPRRVHGDARRVRQVLVNFGSNAVKFTDRGQIRLLIDIVAGGPTPLTCRFAVADTGIGIAATDRHKLFNSFTQLDGSFSRRQEGVGLGLAISRDLVRHMRGEITVDSNPGIGSTFSFTIPFEAPRGPPEPIAERASRPARSGAKVLLVEDIAINRDLARAMLEAHGYEVHVAINGAEGLSQYEAIAPDLVLMDLQMPGMDGFEAVRRIRAGERGGRRPAVPIIAMTGHASADDRNACLGAGMTDCLFKPFSADELQQMVGRYLEGSGAAQGPTSPRNTV